MADREDAAAFCVTVLTLAVGAVFTLALIAAAGIGMFKLLAWLIAL